MKKNLSLLFCCCFWLTGFCRQTISIPGSRRFQTNPGDVGVAEKWFGKKLTETIQLPGSMLERAKAM